MLVPFFSAGASPCPTTLFHVKQKNRCSFLHLFFIPLIVSVSVIIGSITSAVGVYNTMISKNLIDAATSGQVNIVVKWLTVMVAIIIFNLVFGTINSLLSTYTNNKIYNELQKIAVEESRMGIPMIYGRDVIHGHRTVYPLPLATHRLQGLSTFVSSSNRYRYHL